jgi:hypothetical protein
MAYITENPLETHTPLARVQRVGNITTNAGQLLWLLMAASCVCPSVYYIKLKIDAFSVLEIDCFMRGTDYGNQETKSLAPKVQHSQS